VSTASTLQAIGVSSVSGRCPWRLDYCVDGLPVHAFFRPPSVVADQITACEVGLVALPVACHLAASVRPKTVSFSGSSAHRAYFPVFRSAIRALLVEQDATWGRPRFTASPSLVQRGKAAAAPVSRRPLDSKKVVLAFGGGKDSLVCLFGLLRAGYQVIPLLVNEGDRSWQDLRRWLPRLEALGLEPLTAYLRIQPNAALRVRYGDWHLSSYQIGCLLAVGSITATKLGAGVLALGLESSADRVGQCYRGVPVNHQHQKTTRHVLEAQRFMNLVLHGHLRFASPIAPFSDEEVLRALFAGVPPQWRSFSSCGGSNSMSKHCGECAKCAYIFALLARTRKGARLASDLFRRDLFEDIELYRPWLDGRFRDPLACIGESWELWSALDDASFFRPRAPVVRKWLNSPLRQRFMELRASQSRVKVTHAALEVPLERATRLIRSWSAVKEGPAPATQ